MYKSHYPLLGLLTCAAASACHDAPPTSRPTAAQFRAPADTATGEDGVFGYQQPLPGTLSFSSGYWIGFEVDTDRDYKLDALGLVAQSPGIMARVALFTADATPFTLVATTTPMTLVAGDNHAPPDGSADVVLPAGKYYLLEASSDTIMLNTDTNTQIPYVYTTYDFTTPPGQEAAFTPYQQSASNLYMTVTSTAPFAHTCALRPIGKAACWGKNSKGQLGLGHARPVGGSPGDMGANLPSVALGAAFEPVAVAAGGAHSCAVSKAGAVKCWGSNNKGQLGLGDTANRGAGAADMGDQLPAVALGTNLAAAAVALGAEHTCVLLANGGVKCWGANAKGQLGLGDTVDRGGAAAQMGDALALVDLGTNRKALQIVAGKTHTCALLDDHTVKCWGDGAQGQSGAGQVAPIGAAAAQMGDKLLAVDLGAMSVKLLAAGGDQTCALAADGALKCWGANDAGQLGLGDATARGAQPGQMGDKLPYVDIGRLQIARTVACGGKSCCAVTVQNTLKCWGANGHGQLGLGDQLTRGALASDMGDNLPFVDLGSGFAAGGTHLGANHTCATSDAGTWKCWGANADGELGLEDVMDRGDTMATLPAALPQVAL